MLEGVFGNSTAEKVLFFVVRNREAYAQEIADRLRVSLTGVKGQLQRLERGGVLAGVTRGRMRFYALDPRFVVAGELEALLRRAFELLSEKERARYVKRKPR